MLMQNFGGTSKEYYGILDAGQYAMHLKNTTLRLY